MADTPQNGQAGAQDKVEIDFDVAPACDGVVLRDVVSWVDDAGRIVEWKITGQIFR